MAENLKIKRNVARAATSISMQARSLPPLPVSPSDFDLSAPSWPTDRPESFANGARSQRLDARRPESLRQTGYKAR